MKDLENAMRLMELFTKERNRSITPKEEIELKNLRTEIMIAAAAGPVKVFDPCGLLNRMNEK